MKKQLIIVLILFVLLTIFYQVRQVQRQGELTKELTVTEQKLLHLSITQDFKYARDVRDHCESVEDSTIRYTNLTCVAEMGFRMRSNAPTEVVGIYQFVDAWTEEDSFAFEFKMAGKSVYFKPCAVVNRTTEAYLNHKILKKQIAPIVSTRLDHRVLSLLIKGQEEWIELLSDAVNTCGESKNVTTTKSIPRVPGCVFYWDQKLEKWHEKQHKYGKALLLPLLRCKPIDLEFL